MESNNIYKITFRRRAAREYIEAITWYKERSLLAAENFIKAVNEALAKIEIQPDYYRKSYLLLFNQQPLFYRRININEVKRQVTG